ncbi:MAG: hypothetical protein AAB116_01965 [Candidatus Poribacteria bacterium]
MIFRNALSLPKKYGFEILFVLMILIHLFPIWKFPYFPTQDGPSHIYNAQILKDFSDSDYAFNKYYNLNLKLFPNWTCYIVMAFFQYIVSPIVSEKIFLTIYIVTMALSFLYLLKSFGHKKGIFSILGFVYIYNFLFLMGFYNFSIALPLFLFSIGYFWKHKESIKWKNGIILALFLTATFFSHPIPYMVLVIIIFALSLVYFKKRFKGIVFNIGCMIPSLALFAHYIISSGMLTSKRSPSSYWNLPRLLSDLFSIKSLASFNLIEQTKIGYILAGLMGLLLIITIIRKLSIKKVNLIIKLEEKDYMFIALIITFALYVYLPDGVDNQGGFVTSRMNLMTSFLIIPLLSENIGRIIRKIAIALMLILVLGNFVYLYNYFDILNYELEEYNAGVGTIGNNIVMMPLIFDKGGNSQLVQIFTHAPNYYCLDNGNINLGNYEAAQHYFPINFRSEFERPTISQVHYAPNEIDFAKLSSYVDCIVAFGYDKNILDKVGKHYNLVMRRDRLRIFKINPHNSEP